MESNATHRKNVAKFLNTFLLLTIAFVLGIAVALASIVGGIYAALSLITIDKVEGVFGINFSDRFLEEDSELRHLTVIGMVGEAISLSGRLSEVSFNSLIEQYGVIVSDEVMEYIPAGLVDLPFSELAGDDAAHVLLSRVTFGDVFKLSGEILPKALSDKIAPRTTDLAVEQKFDELFEGVYLGDAINIALEVREDGLVYPVVPDGERPSVVQHLSTLDLGEFFAAEDTEKKDAVLNKTLARVPLSDMIAEQDGFFANAVSDKSLGDLLIIKDLSFLFSMDPLIDELYLGHVLGYEEVNDEDGRRWEKDGEPAKGLYRELVDIGVNDLANTDIMAKIDNVYVAELMDYDREQIGVDEETGEPIYRFYKTVNGEKVEPSGITKDIAVLKVGDLRKEDTLNEEIRAMQVGTVMGYTLEEETGKWYHLVGEEKEYAKGVMRPLMGSTISSINDDMNGLYLGQIMGFDNISDDPNAPEFEKEDGTKPGSLMAAFVDVKLSEIDNESTFTDCVKKVSLADAMGYTKNADGDWCEKNSDGDLVPVTGIFAKLADSKVNELGSAADDLTLADAMGYTKNTDGDWCEKNSDGDLVPVTGIFAKLADSKINDLDSAADDLTLSDALGYTYDEDDERWEKNGQPANGIFAHLMESRLDNLSDNAKEISIGEIMGYTKTGEGEDATFTKDGKPATGTIAHFAGLTIGDLENDQTLTDTINSMAVGTAMGYTEVAEGDWRDSNGDEASGFMKLIGPGTTILGLDDAVAGLQTASLDAFIEADILDISPEKLNKFNLAFGKDEWEKEVSLSTFVSTLVNMIP